MQQKIEQWLERAESYYDGLTEAQRTKSYEKIAQRALTKAQDHQINTDDLLNRLRRHGDQKVWYEVLELCIDVMAADGIADIDELHILRKIGDASGIDAKEIQKLCDQKIVDLEIKNPGQTPIEELLGIDADWDLAKIQRHLWGEYKKWNSRLNMVSGSIRKLIYCSSRNQTESSDISRTSPISYGVGRQENGRSFGPTAGLTHTASNNARDSR